MYVNTWRFQLLGGLAAYRSDECVERFQNRKTSGLVGCLAYHAGQWLSRDWLVENLWPDLPADNGRGCLRVSIHSLRRRLEPPGVETGTVIQATRTDVRLNAAAIATDVAELDEYVQRRAEAGADEILERLLGLYQGPLLPAGSEDWLGPQRGRLEHLFVERVSAAVDALIAQGRAPFALTQVLEAIHRAPSAAELHRLALELYRLNGRDQDALGHYIHVSAPCRFVWGGDPPDSVTDVVADLLARNMSASPLRRPRKRRTTPGETVPAAPAGRQPGSEARRSAPRLPAVLTRFFGRSAELDRLVEYLGPTVDGSVRRLVTLTGPPGSGKTRLALEAAGRLRTAYGDRVWFVRLGDLRAGDQVAGEILKTLDGSSRDSLDPVTAIARWLDHGPSLLVLDDLDHVSEACAELLPRLAAAARELTILATSRLPVELDGEHLITVRPLPVPAHSASPGRLLEFASVELFVDRAQHVRPDFQLTTGNSPAVASLCSLLDGLPLAIELAASRLSSLSPQQVLSEMSNRFGFLISRKRLTAEHHSTLDAAIGWSCSLLDDETLAFFRRLSVFRGGWSLDAAKGIWQDREGEAVDLLDTLVRRSLVIADYPEEGSPLPDVRYRMLVSLREYAAKGLTAEERQIASTLAAEHYLKLAEVWGPDLRGGRTVQATAILSTEVHNLRDAYRTLRGTPAGLRLATAVWRLWAGQGLDSEGYGMLTEALKLNPNADDSLRCLAHVGAGMLGYFVGRYEAADDHAKRAIGLATKCGDPPLLGDALNLGGILAGDSGDVEAAIPLLDEALGLRRESGDRWAIASSLNNLARMAQFGGDLDRAEELFNEAYGLFQSVGDLSNAATVMMNLAGIADERRDFRTARFSVERAIDLAIRSGSRHDLGMLYYNLGEAMYRDSQHPDAYRYLLDSVRIHLEQGNAINVPYPLAALANVAAADGDYWRAAQLHGAASSLRLKLQTPMPPSALVTLHDDIDAVRKRSRVEDFDVAWRLGAAMSLVEAVSYAQKDGTTVPWSLLSNSVAS